MKKILLIEIFVYLFIRLHSQNIVPNPSFENYISCPSGQGQLYQVVNWFNPTANTPDYFNACYTTGTADNVDIPINFIGHQDAHTGSGYGGFGIQTSSVIGREYIEVSLMDTLEGGKKYCVEFYVSLADSMRYATDNIGMYLSIDSIFNNTLYNLSYIPQIESPPGNVISDKENWTLISGEYIAQGGERFITIGNFRTNANTTIDTVVPDSTPGIWWNMAYYYIDDVSVYYCGCDTVAPIAKFNYTTDTLTATFNNLSSSFADNWQWYFGDGITDTANSPVHTYDSAGVYDVTFVACYGFCCDTMNGQVSISVGVDELKNADYGLRIYPNPAGEEITVSINTGETNKDFILVIYDVTGRKIKEYSLFKNELKIQTDEFDKGIYFLSLYKNGGYFIATEKIAVVR